MNNHIKAILITMVIALALVTDAGRLLFLILIIYWCVWAVIDDGVDD
jgi:hypothetical protein